MTSTGPLRPGASEPGKATSTPGALQDPWGLKRAENLITSLTGVLGARVVATPLGEVTEIHVLTSSDVQPKQVVRNIESALMAQLGLKVDHRKISVAQTADVRPIDAGASVVEAAPSVVPVGSGRRVVLFRRLEVRPSPKPQRVDVVVWVESEGREAQGVGQGPDTVRSRVESAARAAVHALEGLFDAPVMAVEGAKLVEAFDKTFCLVVLHGFAGRETAVLTGACEVRENPEQAAVLAVLDATNRWAEARR